MKQRKTGAEKRKKKRKRKEGAEEGSRRPRGRRRPRRRSRSSRWQRWLPRPRSRPRGQRRALWRARPCRPCEPPVCEKKTKKESERERVSFFFASLWGFSPKDLSPTPRKEEKGENFQPYLSEFRRRVHPRGPDLQLQRGPFLGRGRGLDAAVSHVAAPGLEPAPVAPVFFLAAAAAVVLAYPPQVDDGGLGAAERPHGQVQARVAVGLRTRDVVL